MPKVILADAYNNYYFIITGPRKQRAAMNPRYKTTRVFSIACLAIGFIFVIWYVRYVMSLSGFIERQFNRRRADNSERCSSPKYRYLDNILQDCGELCDTSRDGIVGAYFNQIHANIQCTSLFRNKDIDRGHGEAHAPEYIPDELWEDFTMNGRVKVKDFYLNQAYLGGKAMKSIWTIEDVENKIDLAKRGELSGNYGKSETNALRDGLRHAPLIPNGRILVIGSENPWVEACVLEAGAREVVTLEYGAIESQHPKIRTMVPYEFRQKYLNGTLGTFDGIVTFSSVEHSGLGRYGDALNPWADIITIARAWCVTRKGGSLTIGVMYDRGKDYIEYNAHRVYGKIRYPYLTTNWQLQYQGQGSQRVHVFVK